MKNLVKFTLVALTFSVLGLSACGKKNETNTDSSATAPVADTTAATAPTPADTTKTAPQQ
jgi:hypothetical protein